MDARYIGRLERGEHRWPFEPYRTALREVLGKATNADLGFLIIQGHARDPEESPDEPGPVAEVPATASGDDLGRTAAAAKAAGPVISVRVAAVRANVIADDVTVVRRDSRTGAVAVLAEPVEVFIEPSDVALEGLAALPDRASQWSGTARRTGLLIGGGPDDECADRRPGCRCPVSVGPMLSGADHLAAGG
ncbi:hypothetical protein [Micromonospora inyonensis]|uniref:hypothetical protein n=1 Tax=Micromonospora inyonensis TaxID=47866 RepID=UPI00114D1C4B|nr:hypothetical protein [Micromonospora inyonensis]